MKEVKPFKCSLFGHKWIPVYIVDKNSKYKFIAVYCSRCLYGHRELVDFIGDKKITNTYDEKYFN